MSGAQVKLFFSFRFRFEAAEILLVCPNGKKCGLPASGCGRKEPPPDDPDLPFMRGAADLQLEPQAGKMLEYEARIGNRFANMFSFG